MFCKVVLKSGTTNFETFEHNAYRHKTSCLKKTTLYFSATNHLSELTNTIFKEGINGFLYPWAKVPQMTLYRRISNQLCINGNGNIFYN